MRMRNLMILALAACAIGLSAARAAEDNQAFEKIERGRYLAVLGDCVGCHTAPGGKPFAGGAALETPFGALVGPNITPDVATGIGAWSESDLWRAMHEGISEDGGSPLPSDALSRLHQGYSRGRVGDLGLSAHIGAGTQRGSAKSA